MRFGNTAVVARKEVAYAPAKRAHLRDVSVGRTERSAEVRVGKEERSARTRTGAVVGAYDPNNPMANWGNYEGQCAGNFDWSKACARPLGVPRTSIAADATTTFSIVPCGPYQLGCIIVPESFALLFEITAITVCRTDYITDAVPAENFSDQSNYACQLGCGSVFYSSQPLLLGVHNISGAAAFFAATILGRELNICA